MGLFSSKKKVSVSSVVYNLAGAEEDRIQYLPTSVVSGVLGDSGFSMGEVITQNLLTGPGIKMRSFGRWARTSSYSAAIGLSASQILGGNNLDIDTIISQIPHAVGEDVNIRTAEIGAADYGFWADRWMMENHPDQVGGNYEVDFSEPLNTIYITFLDGSGINYSFNPVGFNYLAQYLYVSYVLALTPGPGPLVPGTVVDVASPADYPSVVGWTNNGTTTTPSSLVLNETVLVENTYSDGRPPDGSETVTPTTHTFNKLDSAYELETYEGESSSGDSLVTHYQFMHNMRDGTKQSTTDSVTTTEEIEPGVTKTTVTTTTTENFVYTFSYRIDTQDFITKSWKPLTILIYQQNTGNAVLDSMFGVDNSAGTYFPFIPMRLDNNFISGGFYPDIYARNIKAVKKATGADYDKLIGSIAANPSLGDIDYAYGVYGVSLNTAENASKKYVYKFFQLIMQQGGGGIAGFNAWQAAWNVADNSVQVWNQWRTAQSNPLSPLFGTPEPTRIAYPTSPGKSVQIYSSAMNYNMTINWSSMVEAVNSGVGRPGAKVGDLWWTQGTTVIRQENYYRPRGESYSRDVISEFVTLNWQDSANSWRSISMWELNHNNLIYKGKSVGTSAKDALNDSDESGFIIPLNEAVLRSMSLRDSTQMSTACTYIVFNCYQVTKQKWYQSSWFKIVIIIIAIVITVVSMGTGSPASAGLLGTAASVGAALGFAGVVAIIVGTIANAIAAMILTRIITAGATALLGDKIGTIVGAIASVVAVAYGSGELSTTSMASAFSSLSTAKNLLALTLSVGSGISGYINASTKEMQGQIEDLLNTYNSKALAISNAYRDNLGFGKTVFDANQLTDSASNFMTEAPSTFFARTLLVGSDIATLTNTMITNFASMTTTTELPS